MQAAGGSGWRQSRCGTTAWVIKVRATACFSAWVEEGKQGKGAVGVQGERSPCSLVGCSSSS